MKTKEQFVLDAVNIHGDTYDYSNVEYKSNSVKVRIICTKHGEFLQTPRAHLQKRGCPECGKNKKRGTGRRSFFKNRLKFFEAVSEIHNQKYSYDVDSFSGSLNNIRIFCDIHGEFNQEARVHKRGSGCPACAKKGFNPNKQAFLYLIITDTNFVGFGVSGKIKSRLYRHKLNLRVHNINIVNVVLFSGSGLKVLACEKHIKEHFANSKVMIEGFKTEAFTPERLEDVIIYLENNLNKSV